MSATGYITVTQFLPRCTPDRPTCDAHMDFPPCDPLIHSLAWNRMATYHVWYEPDRRSANVRREQVYRNTHPAVTQYVRSGE